MVAPGKGLFPIDVLPGGPFGLTGGWWGPMKEPKTEAAVRDFQEMMFRTPGLGDHISGSYLLKLKVYPIIGI